MFGSTNKGLFGTQTTNASAFGSPGFGTVSTPGTTFGLQTQQQPTSLFGGTSSAFGTTPGTGLFGTQNSIFGSTPAQQTTGFGAPATGTTFGQTGTSLFGTPSTSTQPPLFGGTKFGTTLGNSFGSMSTTAAPMQTPPNGTPIKFNALVGSDTMMKNGVNATISTRHQCITCMKEYESKSLEELRLEDYQANRKGPGVGVGVGVGVGTVFGSTPGTSLFNPNPSTSVSFSTGSTGGLFGNKNTFGSTPATTSTSSLFNTSSFNKPTAFNATGTSPFGAVQPQQQQPSLFGQSNTFSSPNFFSGSQNTTGVKSVFGTVTTSQPSLFNNTTTNTGIGAKPLFGNSTPAFGSGNTAFSFGPTTTTTSLFSSQPSLFNTPATSTANKTTMFNFPSQPLGTQQPASLGASTGTTGSLFNTGGSIFGGNNLFGPMASTNTNNLFSNTSLQTTQNQTPSMSLQQLTTSVQPSNSDLLLSRLQILPYGDSPLFQNNLKSSTSSLKFTTDPKTLYQYKVNFKNSVEQKLPRSPNKVNRSVSLLFDGLEEENPDESKTAADIFVPRKNVKKLVLKSRENVHKSNPEISTDSFKLATSESVNFPSRNILRSSLNETITKPNPAETTIKDLFAPTESPLQENVALPISTTRIHMHSDEIIQELRNSEPLKCGVILTRCDYYTIPKIEQLESIYDEATDTCIVDTFTVGRHDYGSIFWEGPIDLKGLNLDDIVHIRRKEVIVYPDDDMKPLEVGKGLNRPAQVTLHQVWPVDKATHEIIKDVDRLKTMKYAEKIENATIKLGAYFKEYRPDSGTWVFTVKHFSKYGLIDDDDDAEKPEVQDEKMDDTLYNDPLKELEKLQECRSSDSIQSQPTLVCSFIDPKGKTEFIDPCFSKENLLHHLVEESFIKDEDLAIPDKYNAIRAVMFDDEHEFGVSSQLVKKPKKVATFQEELLNESFIKPLSIGKPSCRTKREITLVPFNMPVDNKIVCDIYYYCAAPVCRVNFFNGANNFMLVNGNTVIIKSLDLIHKVTNSDLRFETQLKDHSIIYSQENEIPFVETRKLTNNVHNVARLEKLVVACFSEITIQHEYGRDQQRINKIIDWLCEQNRLLKKPKNVLQCILHCLAENDVKSAVDIALKSRYPNLALVLCSGNNVFNNEALMLQLDSWKCSRADEFIDKQLLKLYVLISGSIKWQLSNGENIHVLENLTWTQQLALMLLFVSHNGLSECIENLTVQTNDVEYHILAEHSPWISLSAADNEMEAWFLHESLQSYGVIPKCYQNDVLHGLLASSLLSKSLLWSCFVACHIRNDSMRQYTLLEVLQRSTPVMTSYEERWLLDTLLIPKWVLSNAKAVYFKTKFDYAKLAVHLLECENWAEGHRVLMEYIFPELVINDEVEVLRDLIERIKSKNDVIPEWFTNGAHIYEVYCDFVQDRIDSENPMVFNIHMMSCKNKRHVLCQSEMARKVSLIQNLLTGGQFALNTPIPDDYVLKELKYNCRSLLREICNQIR